MSTTEKTVLTVRAEVKNTPEKIWKLWSSPEHITQWNTASPDWHTPKAENDLRVGGKFVSRMEAKDGSFGFDFGGLYTAVKNNEHIAYTMDDGRKATVDFLHKGDTVHITTKFEAEDQNPLEMQTGGWQAILNNFKTYAETQS